MVVQERFAELVALSKGVRLSEAELATAVREYAERLALPPVGAEPPLDVVQHANTVKYASATARGWSVDVPLWSVANRRSDLTLQLTVLERPSGEFQIEIDNLHVL